MGTDNNQKDWKLALGSRTGTSVGGPDEILSTKASSVKSRQLQRQDEEDEAAHAAKMAKLAAEAKAAEVKSDQPGGFQVTGKLDMGNFNFMEERKKIEDTYGEIINRTDEDKKQLEQRVLTAEKAITDMKYDQVLKLVEQKNDELMRKMAEMSGGKKDNTDDILGLFASLDKLEPILTKMGYARLSASGGGETHENVEILLKKMDIDNARADREFKWKLIESERENARLTRRDTAEIEIKRQELNDKRTAAEGQRTMVAEAIEAIGRSIGEGLRDASAQGVEEEPIMQRQAGQQRQAPPPPPGQNPPPRTQQQGSGLGPKRAHIEAGVGDSGEVQCPGCAQPIIVAPDTTQASCANCGTTLDVKRVEKASGQ